MSKLVKAIKAWLRYNPPGALSTKGWRLFNEEFKARAPIRYWLDNNFIMMFVYPVKWKYESVLNWIRYRTYDRRHVIKTGLNPGYYGISELVLHANFNTLKIFVEVEQAWHSYLYEQSNGATWIERHLPFYFTFFEFKRPDLGVKHLEWASTLDDSNLPSDEQSPVQAVSAREILTLYKWWTEVRPLRTAIDCGDYSSQGLDGVLGCFDDDFNKNAEDYKSHIALVKLEHAQRDEWEKEDEAMLVRLIRIRNHLWT
jgi:hypothetical protein